MKRGALALPGTFLGLLVAHEATVWTLARSDVSSVLFAPGSHSPVLDLVLTAGFLGLRLTVYFVAPFIGAVWAVRRTADLVNAVAARRASADASHNRATRWQTTAPGSPADLPRASRPHSNT